MSRTGRLPGTHASAVVPKDPGPTTALSTPVGDGGWVVDPGPEDSKAAVRGLELAGADHVTGVIVTRMTEARVGALARDDLRAKLSDHCQVLCAHDRSEDRAAEIVDRTAELCGTVHHPSPGDVIGFGDGVRGVVLTDVGLQNHPDSMAVDIRTRDEEANAANPHNLLLTGGAADNEDVIRRQAEGYYAGVTPRNLTPRQRSSLVRPRTPGEPPSGREWHRRVYLGSDRRDRFDGVGDENAWKRFHATVLDHRGRAGVSDLLTHGTDHVVTGASPPAAFDDRATTCAVQSVVQGGPVQIQLADSGTAITPIAQSARLVDMAGDGPDTDVVGADGGREGR